MTTSPDNEAYWIERHDRLQNQLASVGDITRSEEENLELYARKKSRVAGLLRELGSLDLQGRTVLDAGCGVGMVSELFFALGAKVSGIDASARALEDAGRRCPGGDFRQSSLVDFDFGHTFDLVFILDVLYHVLDDGNWESVLRTLAKHTAPGGRLVVLDQLKAEAFSPAPHVRFRTLEMYDAVLTAAGMERDTDVVDRVFTVYRQA